MSTFSSSTESPTPQISFAAEFKRGIKESLPVLIGFLPIAPVLFTFVGAALAPVIGDLGFYGFDMAFAAFFLAEEG